MLDSWRVHVDWRTSTLCNMNHKQRPMFFGQEMSTNIPWSERIGQATLIVACAQRTSDIVQRHAPASCTHQSCHMFKDSTTLVMDCVYQNGSIFQWKPTSYKASMHDTWCVHIDWETFVVACKHWPTDESDVGQRQTSSTKALMHQLWLLRIEKVTLESAYDRKHKSRPKSLEQMTFAKKTVLPRRHSLLNMASVFTYACPLVDVKHGTATLVVFGVDSLHSLVLQTSTFHIGFISQGMQTFVIVLCIVWSMQRWPTVGFISQGVYAFNVVCAHRQGGVSQIHKASSKVVCFDKETSVLVHIAYLPSNVDFQHRPLRANNSQATSSIVCSHRLLKEQRSIYIGRCLTHHLGLTYWLADIEHGLHTSPLNCA
uniref:Uncharacterized protein n=1 Tax=Solanum lycopersicum TaxID=4081 RepID=A0A3Q7GHV1_SOLLC